MVANETAKIPTDWAKRFCILKPQGFYSLSIFLYGILFLITGCAKLDQKKDAEQLPKVSSSMRSDVDTWLKTERLKVSEDLKAGIAEVGANLDYNNAFLENYGGSEKVLIIPIKDASISKNNVAEKPSLIAVFFFRENRIRRGSLVQYLLHNSQTQNLPKGFIEKVFSGANLENAWVAILSVTDIWQYEMEYKNGKLVSTTKLATKKKSEDPSLPAARCILYYLVTHWSDGTSDWEYLYGVCSNDDCEQTKFAFGRAFRCSGGGGSSSESECDPTSVYPEQQEFDDYVQSSSRAAEIVADVSVDGADAIHGGFSWVVMEASIASWKIMANTNFSYYHSKTFNGQNFDHEFDLFSFFTGAGYYVGSQTFITSTYTTTDATVNRVIDNNSAATKGWSRVMGKIRHRANVEMRLPFCNPLTLDTEDMVDNSVTFRPR